MVHSFQVKKKLIAPFQLKYELAKRSVQKEEISCELKVTKTTLIFTRSTPNCTTSYCKLTYCIFNESHNGTFSKISVPRQAFSSDGQNRTK